MVKIKLTHLSLGQKEMKLRAEYHVHKMDKNLTYAAHQAENRN